MIAAITVATADLLARGSHHGELVDL